MNKNIAKLNAIRLKEQIKSDNNIELKEDLLLLSQGENTEEFEVLKAIGLDTHLRKEIAKDSENKKILHFQDKFKRNVFKGSDIKQLCYDYNLKIFPAHLYEGPVKLEIAKEIIKLRDEHIVKHKRNNNSDEISKSEINLSMYNFFILAKNTNNTSSLTLFYKESTGGYNEDRVRVEDVLIEVTSFGKPYSEFRKLNVLFYSDDVILGSNTSTFFAFIIFWVSLFSDTLYLPSFLLLFCLIYTNVCNLFKNEKIFENSWNKIKEK